jgi:hypothetical protein
MVVSYKKEKNTFLALLQDLDKKQKLIGYLIMRSI